MPFGKKNAAVSVNASNTTHEQMQALFEQADEHKTHFRFVECKQLLQKLLQVNARHAGAYLMLGQCQRTAFSSTQDALDNLFLAMKDEFRPEGMPAAAWS